MAGHCDSCRGQLPSPWRRAKREKREGGGAGWNDVAWEEYHKPATKRWRRRQPQVASTGRSREMRGARRAMTTGQTKKVTWGLGGAGQWTDT
jgi:hypothetical protein